mgnify:CR=1 FL=1
MSETKVSITFDEYNQLLNRDQELCALESAGVDNWEGYEEAMNILEEWNSED